MELEQRAQELLKSRTTCTDKEWSEYTPQEKRIAIAYDVIQATLAGVYTPSMEYYFDVDKINNIAELRLQNQVQALLVEDALMDIEVDPIGAAFLSLVRFENHYLAGELGTGLCFSHESNRKRLLKIFGETQLDMIESAFACTDMSEDLLPVASQDFNHAIYESVEFGKKYEYQVYERFLAIWINIINNNGTFNPIPENVNAD